MLVAPPKSQGPAGNFRGKKRAAVVIERAVAMPVVMAGQTGGVFVTNEFRIRRSPVAEENA